MDKSAILYIYITRIFPFGSDTTSPMIAASLTPS